MNLVARRAAAIASRGREAGGRRALVAGAAALAVVGAGWAAYAADHPAAWILYPVDLRVYWDGGLIARHAAPAYDPRLASPLYDWASPTGLKFTYTPFAAATFALVSVVPWRVLPRLSQAVSLVALAAAAWFTMAALGCASRRARAGAALAGMAAGLVTEPVFRTLYLGQVNLVLMALILWDLTRAPRPGSQPGGRGWAGLATGIAAGIKLTPLVFLPYLLLTRRLREAALAGAGFAVTVAVGFAVAPGDSANWWLHGLFFAGGRTGFAGWGGNQSLYGLAIRLAGSVTAAIPAWVAAVIVVTVAGLLAAAQLTRAGHLLLGLLATALVGLLDSPISWDHHWVWVMPAMMAAAGYAARAARGGRRRAALAWLAVAAGLLLVTFPWPGGLWSVRTTGAGNFTTGLLWAAPDSPVWYYVRHGDQPWFAEYHWRGLQLLAGNAYVLSGLALLAGLVTLAAATRLAGPPGAGVVGRRVARPAAEPVT